MKTKVCKILTSALVLGLSFATVFAAPSQQAQGEVIEATVDGKSLEEDGKKVVIQEISEENEPKLVNSEEGQKILEQINQLNNGAEFSKVLEDVINAGTLTSPLADVSIRDFKLLTQVQSLNIKDLAETQIFNDGVKGLKVKWEVPNLASNLQNVMVLHYSVTRSTWEIIEPDELDFTNKTVTATFQDLSPVAIIYTGVETDANTAPSTQTGDNSNVALYAGLAVVAVVALGAIVVYKKKKVSE